MVERTGYKIHNNFRNQIFVLLIFNILLKATVYGRNAFPPIGQNENETNVDVNLDFNVSISTTHDVNMDFNFSKTTTDYHLEYYLYEYDPTENFTIESDYCKNKYNCSKSPFNYQTFPEKLCHCDRLCGLMDDCCGNYDYTSTLPLTKDQFECVYSYEIVKNPGYGINMVTKCSPGWEHMLSKRLCENDAERDDIFLRLPVSDKTEFHVTYKNMYCAQCNYVVEFQYWKQEIKCQNETGMRTLPEMDECNVFFIRPEPEISHRTCQLSQSIISNCSSSVVSIEDAPIDECNSGVYGIVYDDLGRMYRNKHCAMCNGVIEGSVFCEQLYGNVLHSTPLLSQKSSYSLRLIVDINTGTLSRNDKSEDMGQCEENEIFDVLSQICRRIFCAPPLTASNGMCIKSLNNESVIEELTQDPFPDQGNCTYTKIDPSEYELRNNSRSNVSEVYIFSHQKVYNIEKMFENGSDVYICLDDNETCSKNCGGTDAEFHSDVIESYFTLVGLVISILSLAITLVIYIAFPQLLNTPGKILVSLIISLLLAQILFVSAAEAEYLPTLCFVLAVSIHYFFLAAFCWMNVIAFDLWMTFSNRFMTPASDRKGQKRFVMYSLYAWILPGAVVCTAVILDFVIFDDNFYSLKPGYGNGVCWISSRNALILFFAGPLAVFKIFDIISFISTAIHISHAKKQGAMATRKKNACSLIVNIKLSFIMGLTWVFAFVANATNETSMWYLFIIFNSLQGLFIAICFVCTKKIGRLVGNKYRQVTTKTTSGTQILSLS